MAPTSPAKVDSHPTSATTTATTTSLTASHTITLHAEKPNKLEHTHTITAPRQQSYQAIMDAVQALKTDAAKYLTSRLD
ncbi:hypothetical protein BWQ96_01267 [Gracilariopsis chorda]|uniref:Uncharacterized protein n=1 Tax=Gracilariopsis chorda TaxID=448386 RepID=A0A2V3J3F9_9FLOR|nr:hypothetical protein BWQ96_01267 [Gracilariopsis chorda]|eukprot:PXF48925.1 hypothetical protein BWQ96_01267 [Gracilariopsis chorda]